MLDKLLDGFNHLFGSFIGGKIIFLTTKVTFQKMTDRSNSIFVLELDG